MPVKSDQSNYIEELYTDLASFTHDPLGYAYYAFPWGEEGTSLANIDGPRDWQADCLREIGEHLQNPLTRHEPCQIARASGHGIGKSALMSIITKWGLDTCENTRIVITANTESQILGKTWPEITKWHNLSITAPFMKCTATALFSTEPGHEKQWRADAVTWSERNTEAFAGLHNKGSRIIILYDEASGIMDKVWEVTQGALTDEDTEIIWIVFGNPTKNTGRFRECFRKERKIWKTAQIDSRDVEGTNKKYLQQLCDTYGENSDIAKVRVKGQFPSASTMQLIGTDVVEAAQTREVSGLVTDPVIFGVDCARYGDDHSTLAIRCGRDARSRPWKRWNDQDSMTLAGDIALEAAKWKPDAIFVDAGNIGAAVIDRLRQLGVENVFEVWFGGKGRPIDWVTGMKINTYNKRSEIWCSMRGWLANGAIPDDQQLMDDLIGVEYQYGADEMSIMLEKKKDMKKRGLPSPDDADALACTFAEFVAPRELPRYLDQRQYAGNDDHDSRYDELD